MPPPKKTPREDETNQSGTKKKKSSDSDVLQAIADLATKVDNQRAATDEKMEDLAVLMSDRIS